MTATSLRRTILTTEAVPEGTVVPVGALQRAAWHPCDVGTVSWTCRQRVREAIERTSDHPELVRQLLRDEATHAS